MAVRENKGKSIIDFPREYVCLDVETTGLDPSEDEIIEVAALLIRDGVEIDRFTSLIRPKKSHALLLVSKLHAMEPHEVLSFWDTHLVPDTISKLTGITDEMLLSAPYGEEVFPQLSDFIGEKAIVGHNVNFDINFIYDAFNEMGLTLSNNYIDTLRIARNLFPEMEHHRLSDLLSKLEVEIASAHRASDDAAATSECFEKMRGLITEGKGIDEFKRRFLPAQSCTHKRKFEYVSPRTIIPDTSQLDESHPLYSKRIVFTGQLSMPRCDAAQLAANCGARVVTSVSKKTDYLVVGEQDVAIVGDDGLSSKEEKAYALNASGAAHIRILSEAEFLSLVRNGFKEK